MLYKCEIDQIIVRLIIDIGITTVCRLTTERG